MEIHAVAQPRAGLRAEVKKEREFSGKNVGPRHW
jgi:hypothetical protein